MPRKPAPPAATATPDLDKALVPGGSVRYYFGKGHPSNATWHIRGVVDGNMIVARVWSKRAKMWSYRVEPRDFFDLALAMGHLRPG